ncbi:MAG: hypothetical protein HOE90_03830 [Bacteriovoracaceae bacterium]|jgi:hypothetical protein|nr:hypothetical protein [Bacteriovoracaceae bacterium]
MTKNLVVAFILFQACVSSIVSAEEPTVGTFVTLSNLEDYSEKEVRQLKTKFVCLGDENFQSFADTLGSGPFFTHPKLAGLTSTLNAQCIESIENHSESPDQLITKLYVTCDDSCKEFDGVKNSGEASQATNKSICRAHCVWAKRFAQGNLRGYSSAREKFKKLSTQCETELSELKQSGCSSYIEGSPTREWGGRQIPVPLAPRKMGVTVE